MVDVLDWAAGASVAVVPYGGGSSVVGGVEYRGDEHPRRVSLDLTALDRVLEVDQVSRRRADPGGRVRPGAGGPAARARPDAAPLPPELRVLHARRLAGHPRRRALRHRRDPHRRPDRVHPRGHPVGRDRVAAAARLGRRPVARPDAAGLRGHARRDHRGVDARAPAARPARLGQRPLRRHASRPATPRAPSPSPGLRPSNCRLLDPGEAAYSGAGDGSHAVLVLAFEASGVPVADRLGHALELTREHGGEWDAPRAGSGGGDDAAGAWRDAFLRMPYMRDAVARMGGIAETFETATTWDRVGDLYDGVRSRDDRGHRGDLRRARHPELPAHARVPRRRGAVLHGDRRSAGRPGAALLGRDQGGRRRDPVARTARPSPTTTPSGATTGPGTTASARSRSPPRCARSRPSSTRRAS